MRENDFLYTDETKVKDLTVGELKDVLLECLIRANNSRTIPLNCIGKELVSSAKPEGIIY